MTGPLDYNILIFIILGGKYQKLEAVGSSEALQQICSSRSDQLSEKAIGISRMLRASQSCFMRHVRFPKSLFSTFFASAQMLQYL